MLVVIQVRRFALTVRKLIAAIVTVKCSVVETQMKTVVV